MTTPLTPTLALAYLLELSIDVRAAVVLDAAGGVLAGEPELGPRAHALLAGGPAGVQVEHGPDGTLFAARGDHGAGIAVLAGDRVFAPLLSHDLLRTVDAVVPASRQKTEIPSLSRENL
jgi:hypothetical protein